MGRERGERESLGRAAHNTCSRYGEEADGERGEEASHAYGHTAQVHQAVADAVTDCGKHSYGRIGHAWRVADAHEAYACSAAKAPSRNISIATIILLKEKSKLQYVTQGSEKAYAHDDETKDETRREADRENRRW